MKYTIILFLCCLPLRSFAGPVVCSYVGPIAAFGLLPTKKDPNILPGIEATLMPCDVPIIGVVMKSQFNKTVHMETLAAQMSLGIAGFELGVNRSSWGTEYSTHFQLFFGLPIPTRTGEDTGDSYFYGGAGFKYNDLHSKPINYFSAGFKLPLTGNVFQFKLHT